ncbi:hypothetical protein [Streptomyces sp. NPDC092952]|uniref:hypothetical protein n=1 Tax=Streptomyces sp. NPDC092952 TaxID=3366018 RepID=UPI00380DB2BA
MAPDAAPRADAAHRLRALGPETTAGRTAHPVTADALAQALPAPRTTTTARQALHLPADGTADPSY